MPKQTSAKSGTPKAKPHKHKSSFSVAAKLLTSAAEQKKFAADPAKYLAAKKISRADIRKTSNAIKALSNKHPITRNGW